MIDPNRTIAGDNSNLTEFQKDKNGLLSTKIKEKFQIANSNNKVFMNTSTAPELKSGFKQTVKLSPIKSPDYIDSARDTIRSKDTRQVL